MVKVRMVPGSPKLIGAKALAAELGVSVAHLWRVRAGERQSRRIEAALAANGIKIDRPPRSRGGRKEAR